MVKPHILLVDDDPVTLSIIKGWIVDSGSTVESAQSGPEAIARLEANPFTLLITDEEMPGMKGSELIGFVHDRFPDVPSLVISGKPNMEGIVNAMSGHKALDYLFKPFTKEQLYRAMDRAFEFSTIQRKAVDVYQGERAFFQTVLDTFDWKETLRRSRNESLASDMINQINIGFFQGKGLGSLISCLAMVFERAKKGSDTDKYVQVPDVLFEMAKESFEQSLIVIQSMTRAQSALTSTVANIEPMSARDFFGVVQRARNELIEMLAIKKQRICIGDMPPMLQNDTVDCDPEQITAVLRELLINAMKYSHEEDTIYVLAQHKEDFLEIKILNPAYESANGEVGICGKYENLVFEPFFRMSKVVDERYVREDLPYGLGLPVAKRVIEQHHGSIFVYTLDNHLNAKPEKDICVSIRLPLRHHLQGERTSLSGLAQGGCYENSTRS